MRGIAIVAALLLVVSCAWGHGTEDSNIVDPDGDGLNPDYDGLTEWDAGEAADITHTGSGVIAVADCRCTGGTADDSYTASNGWTTDADHYVKIWTDPDLEPSYRHNGTYQTGNKFRIETTGSSLVLSNLDDYALEGIQTKATLTASFRYGIQDRNGTANSLIDQCIVVGVLSGSADNCFGMRIDTGGGAVTVRNTMIYGWNNTAGETGNKALDIQGFPKAVTLYNVTIWDCYAGIIATGDPTVVVKNCVVQDGGNGNDYTGVDTGDYNISDDELPAGGNSKQCEVTFLGEGAPPDLHLDSADTCAKVTGEDLSGDGVTEDIDGDTRTVWHIGADEVVGAEEEAAGQYISFGALVPPTGRMEWR